MTIATESVTLLSRIFVNPFNLFLFMCWLLFTITEYYGKSHPTHYILKELKYLQTTKGIDLSIPISFVELIKTYKHQSTLILLSVITVVLKPNYSIIPSIIRTDQ